MKATRIVILAVVLLPAASHSPAAVLNWQFSSGLPPDRTWPAWEQKTGGSPTPTLTPLADALELNSSANNAWGPTLYFQQSGPVLAFSGAFTIEARLRLVSSGFVGTTYCPCTVTWASGGGVGNALGFAPGKIFLFKPGNTFDTQVDIDTASFHTYRIEVDGTAAGSAIRVFQDGVLKVSGSSYSDASWWGTTPTIWWGDGTGQGYAKSEWQSIRHSVAAQLPVKYGKILFGYVGKHMSALSTTNGQAKTVFADANVPASPFEYVVQLTAQPGTGMFYGLITPVVGGYPTPKLLRVDPFTGQSTVVGFIQTADGRIKDVEGLAFHPLTGELFGSMRIATDPLNASLNLIRIEPATGLAIPLGKLGFGQMKSDDIDSIAFDSAGNMYAVDVLAITSEFGTYLYRLQQDGAGTWSATAYGTVPGKLCSGFAYSPEDAAFYCSEYQTRKLLRIVPGSNTATEIGTIHATNATAYGLAFATPIERSPLAATLDSGNVSIRCPSLAGLTYQLWSSPGLTQWQFLGSPVDGTGTTLEWTTPVVPEPAKFFRAHVVDHP